MSCPANPLDCTTGLVGTAIGGAASSAWDEVCKSFADAAAQILGAFGTAFVAIPPVNLGSAGVRNVYAICLGLAAVVAALLLLGQVVRTAVTHDGSGLAQGLTGVGKAALASLLTLTIAATALEAADQLTRFIVTQTFGSVQALSGKIASLVAWNVNVQATLILIFAVVGILLTIVLWFEMLLRNAAIAVLVATSPIAAAGQASRCTQGWWPRLAASTAQLIVLKPVIALVFCVGFSLTGNSRRYRDPAVRHARPGPGRDRLARRRPFLHLRVRPGRRQRGAGRGARLRRGPDDRRRVRPGGDRTG